MSHNYIVPFHGAYQGKQSEYPMAESLCSKLDIFDRRQLNNMQALFYKSHQDENTLMKFSAATANYGKTLCCYFSDKSGSAQLDMHIIQPVVEFALQQIQQKIEEGNSFNPDAQEAGVRECYYLSIISDQVDKIQSSPSRNPRLPELYFLERLLIRLIECVRIEVANRMFQDSEGPFADLQNSLLPGKKDTVDRLKNHIISNLWTYNNKTYIREFSVDQKKLYNIFYNSFFLEVDKIIFNQLSNGLKRDLIARGKNPEAPLIGLVTLAKYEVELQKKRRLHNLKIASIGVGILLLVGIAVKTSPEL